MYMFFHKLFTPFLCYESIIFSDFLLSHSSSYYAIQVTMFSLVMDMMCLERSFENGVQQNMSHKAKTN